MLFRRARSKGDPAVDRWRALAERLELHDAGDVAERIRRWLDLDDAQLEPVYLLQRDGLPAVYLYDAHTTRRGPSGAVRFTRRCCLVRSDTPVCAVAFRAMPRQNKAVEAIEAGRSGGARIAIPSDATFEAAVSVFARDAEAARGVLAGPVREVLARTLTGRGARAPRLVVGERHLVVTFDVTKEDVDLLKLERVLADTLSLVALLPGPPAPPEVVAVVADEEPPVGGRLDPTVSISPDDLLDLG
jgi:hypothetical protein